MLPNCSEMFILGTNWRPDILWSANKLARLVTKWTRACDKRFVRLISDIHHTSKFSSIVPWETLHNNAGWDCFKMTLPEILKIHDKLQRIFCAYLEVIRLFS